MSDQTNKPGCFGVSFCYETTELCGRCRQNSACKQVAITELEAISSTVNVERLLLKIAGRVEVGPVSKRRSEPVEEKTIDSLQHDLLVTMPKKPAEIARRLFVRGIDLKSELQYGRNPYSRFRPEFMKIACDLVLQQGGFTRSQLQGALMNSDKIGTSSVQSYSAISCSVLLNLGVVRSFGQRLELEVS